MKILKEVKNSPFKPLIKKYYLGKIVHGAPYFSPRGFHRTIISIRKLKLRAKKDLEDRNKRFPHLKETKVTKFSNLPMVRRSKNWIIKFFGNYYYVEIGFPIMYHINDLGWKDKYNSPRFEWSPAFHIFLFKWQFCVWWKSPNNNEDNYWEMFLFWKYYCKEDIKEAEKEWGWANFSTGKSTWDKDNLKL